MAWLLIYEIGRPMAGMPEQATIWLRIFSRSVWFLERIAKASCGQGDLGAMIPDQ